MCALKGGGEGRCSVPYNSSELQKLHLFSAPIVCSPPPPSPHTPAPAPPPSSSASGQGFVQVHAWSVGSGDLLWVTSVDLGQSAVASAFLALVSSHQESQVDAQLQVRRGEHALRCALAFMWVL